MPDPAHLFWWQSHDNLVILVDHLAAEGYNGHEVAYAVSKPWKYEDEFRAARAILDGTSPLVLSDVRVRFRPQAWQNDYIIAVDPEGETEWTVSQACLDHVLATYLWEAVEKSPEARTHFRDDPAAPFWIRDWPGPFDVDLVPDDVPA